jgi:hypothetical protein
MLFLSRERSPSLLMVPGYTRVVETIHGALPEVRKPVWVKFRPIGTPMIAPGLPAKRRDGESVGKAQGFVETEQYAKEIGIEESRLIDFLQTHNSHGVEFIGLTDEGTEIAPEDSVFVPNGEGAFYCNVCAQQLSSIQGVTGHKQSKKHQMLFEEYVAEQQRVLEASI